MRIVVIGAAGRLGATVRHDLLSAGHHVDAPGRAELDICDARQVATAIERLQPDAIVNCSAYNAVDAAEADPTTAFAVNAQGPSLLAAAARAIGAVLVHYSTDFVFDGETQQPYSEDQPTNPLSVYGASKLAGENEVRSAPRHYILRLESVFGGSGRNGHRATVDQMTDKLLAGVTVPALADRTVSPSYVVDVAHASRMLVERDAPHGTYHCVNSGCTTWVDLATEVARQLGVRGRIEPVQAANLNTPARRPRFCALSNRKLLEVGVVMPTWQSAIGRHLLVRRGQSSSEAATA
jgi:dTDP-4-dehydrorhamnose reductase